MCDTIVALGSATKDGSTLFGKNSNREPDEVQNLHINPRKSYSANETVKCTYIEIPQVEETYRVLLSKPFWMFGAEMGANEHGVVIGNEALMTKVKPGNTGLTGMDLLRLTLERSVSAKSALDTLIKLLETHGQGGNCGYRRQLKYMNSFIIADRNQAFVLETIDKNWAWKEVNEFWSISNKISIERDYDASSPGLINYAKQKGWCKSEDDFNFYKNYSDKLMTWGAAGFNREQTNRCHLRDNAGSLTEKDFMSFLRHHKDKPNWLPQKDLRFTVCAHAANHLSRPDQTVNSLVGKIMQTSAVWYTTGAASPCISPYFPIFGVNTGLPREYFPGDKVFNNTHYWWVAEKFHRLANFNFTASRGYVTPKIHDFESECLQHINDLLQQGKQPDQNVIDYWFEKAINLTKAATDFTQKLPKTRINPIYRAYWNKYNKQNHVPMG